MDGCRDYHTKGRNSERERIISYDITYMWNLKYITDKCMFKTESEAQRNDREQQEGGGTADPDEGQDAGNGTGFFFI